MQVKTTKEGERLTVAIDGSIDTVTAPTLETSFDATGAKEIVFDITNVEYVSSAGLRVFLATHKALSAAGGKLTIVGASPSVSNVIRITGFSKIFNMA